MADHYLVEQAKGPAWDHARGRREQAGWEEHAAFMDGLVEEGLVVLGGPIGEGDGDHALLVMDAPDEATIAKVSVVLGARGSAKLQTLTAIAVDDFIAALDQA